MERDGSEPVRDEEVAEFVVGRLAELVVVLLGQHVGVERQDKQIRADSVAILMTLGNWAARHGRADLLPLLHARARQIANSAPLKGAAPALSATLVKRVRFSW